jgi:molecular chaperone IbpA
MKGENIMTTYTITTFDLPTLSRNAVGFDRLFNELGRSFANSKTDNYPPHNIVQIDETHYAIQLAVAGFSEDELDIEYKDNVLIVKGEKKEKEEYTYHYRGISSRNFTRSFPLADHMEVRGATVVNGILAISVEHIVPEEDKPKKIAITFAK